jgi:NitT/TauT family transport system substrate-binding protein
MKMVASLQRSDTGGSGSGILVRKELIDRGLVRDWPDLRGRSVAVPARGSVNDYTLARGLQQAGMSLADVDLVEMSFPDMIPALANGNLDAGLSTEPLTTLAAERGIALKWKDNGEYLPGISPAVMSFAPAFMESQADAGRRWMIAYLRGARDFNNAIYRGERRADVMSILVKHTTVKDLALYDRRGFATIDPNGTLNVANLADQAAWYSEQGYAQGTIDVGSLIDGRFLEAAIARLGPYQP